MIARIGLDDGDLVAAEGLHHDVELGLLLSGLATGGTAGATGNHHPHRGAGFDAELVLEDVDEGLDLAELEVLDVVDNVLIWETDISASKGYFRNEGGL